MRSKMFAVLLGGLAAVAALPALACSYHTTASADQTAPQQTAQAQDSDSSTATDSSSTESSQQ